MRRTVCAVCLSAKSMLEPLVLTEAIEICEVVVGAAVVVEVVVGPAAIATPSP